MTSTLRQLPSPREAPIQPYDRALIEGGGGEIAGLLTAYTHDPRIRDAVPVDTLVRELAVRYVAATLVFLTHVLPPIPSIARRVLGAGHAPIAQPQAELMERNPIEALQRWARRYRKVGGTLLYEARGIFLQLTVPRVLVEFGLPIPPDTLASVRFPEEMPDPAYLRRIVTAQTAGGVRWIGTSIQERDAEIQELFAAYWVALGVRLLRVREPERAHAVESRFEAEGTRVADALLRMYLPMQIYREWRLNALAIYNEMMLTPSGDGLLR